MIGPRLEENPNSETVVLTSNYTYSQSHSAPRAKRKLFSKELNSIDNEDENACAKKLNSGENFLNIENGVLPTRLEVVVVNGTWDTSQSIPSIIAEMHTVNFQDLDVVNEFCIPWSESSGTEISVEDDSGVFEQSSESTIIIDSSFDFSVDSCSDRGESTSITPHQNPECKNTSNDAESNCDENLSWLINFKVGNLFNADEVVHDHNYQGKENNEVKSVGDSKDGCYDTAEDNTTRNNTPCDRLFLSDSNVNVRKMQVNNQEKRNHSNRYSGLKKPPFTYTELIEQALQEKGELTVSGIYQWISEHFPFYNVSDDRWKNSVRHNLSINPYFRKGSKAPHGAGHLWTIANRDEHSKSCVEKRKRMQQFLSNVVTIDEVEAATASIEDNKENRDLHRQMLLTINTENCIEIPETSSNYTPQTLSPHQGVSLEQSAEEILSGIKKEVQVQYLIPVQEKLQKQTDFLNPVSKEIVVEESGLLEKMNDTAISYLINDTSATALSLNIGEAEIITADNLFGEEIGLQYYELISPTLQLQG